MDAFPIVEQGATACLDVDSKEIALQVMALVGGYDDTFLLLVETKNVHDYPLSLGQLTLTFSFYIKKVDMVITVTLAL